MADFLSRLPRCAAAARISLLSFAGSIGMVSERWIGMVLIGTGSGKAQPPGLIRFALLWHYRDIIRPSNLIGRLPACIPFLRSRRPIPSRECLRGFNQQSAMGACVKEVKKPCQSARPESHYYPVTSADESSLNLARVFS